MCIRDRAGLSQEQAEAEGAARPRAVSVAEAQAVAETLRTAGGRRVRYVDCASRSGRGVERAVCMLVREVLSEPEAMRLRREAAARPPPVEPISVPLTQLVVQWVRRYMLCAQ